MRAFIFGGNMKEIWESISDYKGFYEVSNFGEVKGLQCKVWNGKAWVNKQEIMLKAGTAKKGYKVVCLCKRGVRRTVNVHTLVWDAFGNKPRNGMKLQVDHKDEIKANNRIDNLQLLTQRENCSKGHHQKGRVLPTGVRKRGLKYESAIQINGKYVYLGRYYTIEEASQAYKFQALKLT